MPLLSKPAFGPRTAIIYITLGSLIDVWTAVWYLTHSDGPISRNTWFWLAGLFLTGLTLIVIGFFLGQIGRAARKAELPPKEAQHDEAVIQQTAAAVPHPVVGANTVGAAPVMATPMMGNGMPVGTAVQPIQAAPQQFVPGVTRR